MSSINKGSQILTFDFRQEATSINFNKYSSNLIKPGIYKGGRVYFERYSVSNTFLYRYIIERFTAAFLIPESSSTDDINKKLLVNVTTNGEADFQSQLPTNAGNTELGIPSTGNSLYLIMVLNWDKAINNYIDFSVISDLANLPTNGLVLCRLYGNGQGNKPDIYYDATSFGSNYESYDDKFTDYNNGNKGVSSNYGKYNDPTLPRRLIPFSSNFYLLRLTSYSDSINYHYISFQPFNGQLELVNRDDFREKIKFTFDMSGNLNVEVSAKTKLVNSSSRVSNFLSFNVDSQGRLNIFNGYSSSRNYMLKTDMFNISRVLNTVNSIS
jgi:hypothetical protein